MKKSIVYATVLLALGAQSSAFAGDMPMVAAPESVVSSAEHLTSARNAIAAKDWTRAISHLQTAAKDDAGNADVHNLLAYSYRKQAKPDLPRAFDHYKKALAINPKHLGAHEYIGEAYLMDKKPLEAQKHLDEIEKICGNRSCEAFEDLAKALATYRKLNP
jgi:tetratricopeptide (TPR) repeat protein